MKKISAGATLVIITLAVILFLDSGDRTNFTENSIRFFIPSLVLYLTGFIIVWLGIFDKVSMTKWVKYVFAIILGGVSFYVFAKLVLNL